MMDRCPPEKPPAGIRRLTLPPELLSVVFSLTVYQPYPDPQRGPQVWEIYQRLKDALKLSSVCRAWRDVANSTRALWCILYLKTKDSGSRPNLIPKTGPTPRINKIYPGIDLVERWAERSAAYPLDLVLVLLNCLEREEQGLEEARIVELVRGNRERLRSLRITYNSKAKLGSKVLRALFGGSNAGIMVPKLKLEVLRVQVMQELINSKRGTITIPYSDRLRELYLELGTITPVVPPYTLTPGTESLRMGRFNNLRSLTIKDTQDATDCLLDVLEASAATLESFTWTTTPFSPPSIQKFQKFKQITLPALTSLSTTTYFSPAPLFALLTTPSLTSLHITVNSGCDLPLILDSGLLSRSLCPRTGKTKLEVIDVEMGTELSPRDVLEVLRVSPGLRRFFFPVYLSEELALSLVSDSEEGETTLAPLLHVMEFNRSWEGEYIPFVEAFAKMVRSRWGGPSGLYPGKGSLTYVRVDYIEDDEEELIRDYLKDCIEEGLTFSRVDF